MVCGFASLFDLASLFFFFLFSCQRRPYRRPSTLQLHCSCCTLQSQQGRVHDGTKLFSINNSQIFNSDRVFLDGSWGENERICSSCIITFILFNYRHNFSRATANMSETCEHLKRSGTTFLSHCLYVLGGFLNHISSLCLHRSVAD